MKIRLLREPPLDDDLGFEEGDELEVIGFAVVVPNQSNAAEVSIVRLDPEWVEVVEIEEPEP